MSYRRFLLEHDGGEPEDNEFEIPNTGNASGVNEFLSSRQIEEEIERHSDRFPGNLVPIAYAEGGNLVFLSVEDERALFWDHELEDADPFFEVSPSFDAFLNALEPFDPSKVELGPDQVESVWVDPDLLN